MSVVTTPRWTMILQLIPLWSMCTPRVVRGVVGGTRACSDVWVACDFRNACGMEERHDMHGMLYTSLLVGGYMCIGICK